MSWESPPIIGSWKVYTTSFETIIHTMRSYRGRNVTLEQDNAHPHSPSFSWALLLSWSAVSQAHVSLVGSTKYTTGQFNHNFSSVAQILVWHLKQHFESTFKYSCTVAPTSLSMITPDIDILNWFVRLGLSLNINHQILWSYIRLLNVYTTSMKNDIFFLNIPM